MNHKHLLAATFALVALAYAFRPAAYELWNPDEPRRAQVAREMLRSGDLLLLTHGGESYYDKPPLYFWLVAAISWPFGDVTETTARLPSILSVLGLFVLMFEFLRRRFERPETSLLAALITVTAPMMLIHPYLGRAANIDMLLCFLTTASIFAFWKQTWRWTIVAGVLCGLAILAKGPPGLLVPAIGFGALSLFVHNGPTPTSGEMFLTFLPTYILVAYFGYTTLKIIRAGLNVSIAPVAGEL